MGFALREQIQNKCYVSCTQIVIIFIFLKQEILFFEMISIWFDHWLCPL